MISRYLSSFDVYFPGLESVEPWHFTTNITTYLSDLLNKIDRNVYDVTNDIAVHHTATIEHNVVLKGPIIIGPNSFVGSYAYLRGGVFMGKHVSVGPGCEIKSSVILDYSALAHFNFIGDSMIGSYVNVEAGAVLTNYYNERDEKVIYVRYGKTIIKTELTKFGAVIGDGSKIGANSVCSPGTILNPGAVVKRLELIEQMPEM